jgi:hypothetical protein
MTIKIAAALVVLASLTALLAHALGFDGLAVLITLLAGPIAKIVAAVAVVGGVVGLAKAADLGTEARRASVAGLALGALVLVASLIHPAAVADASPMLASSGN